jgi:NAD(P)-dependent dehydrogenase (short-subunit alcohol dehydrogenase family)
MPDLYQQLVNNPIGRIVTRQAGLPSPVPLERYEPGQPVVTGPALLRAWGGSGRLTDAASSVLARVGAEVRSPGSAPAEETLKALLFDATGITSSEALRDAREFFSPTIRRIRTARGVGEAIAGVLARDGVHVVCLDVPGAADAVAAVAARIGGSSLTVDIAEGEAPGAIASHLLDAHGGVDVVVHNAGVTRDKTLGRMAEELWRTVLEINLIAPRRIDRELLRRGALRENGRIVGVSSISGFAGNPGQTNYATAKAGVIGIVDATAAAMAERGATINAVAPGFIETRMTAAMPIAMREAGRRMNSVAQGGLPVDVAETVAWLAHPGSAGVNGNVVRVCGQSLIGA